VVRRLAQRPAIRVEAAVAVAWIALIAFHPAGTPPDSGRTGGLFWWCLVRAQRTVGSPAPTGHGVGVSTATVASLSMWSLMVVAMMLPSAIPAVRHVAIKSFRWRRQRAMVEFAAVYVALWVLFGGLVLMVFARWTPARPDLVLAMALAVAAAWQLTMAKRRAIVRCHRSYPLPPKGWRATAGVAHFALRNGSACIASCWALMLVAALATSRQLLWMVVVTGIVSAEKLLRKPRRATRYSAALLGAAALGTGLLALTA
jgi:predicted metal-binding membrane protein